MGCSLPETLELGARGNAEKNGGPGPEILRNKAALPPDGRANPQKETKPNKNGFLDECGSYFFGGWNS